MNEDEYIALPEVAGFIKWLQARLRGKAKASFSHKYTRGKHDWQCTSFYNAFGQYKWPFSYKNLVTGETINGKCYAHSEVALADIRSRLRDAIRRGDNEACHKACQMILDWGGVQSGNLVRIDELRPRLAEYLGQVQNLFNANPLLAPQYQVCVNGEMEDVQMTTGFSKIYSLACNDFIIYDSRVSAALSLLVRYYLEGEKQCPVPKPLRFRLCAAHGNVNRNPSRDPLVFQYAYPNYPAPRIRSNLKANWIIRNLDLANAPGFANQHDPLRAFEAALFMIGYKV